MGKYCNTNKVKAVFLDRDGVINYGFVRNGKSYPPSTLAEFQIMPGVKEALNLLHKAGFLLIVVTNQPDVAKKKQRKEIVESMHSYLMQELPLDAIEVCFEQDGYRFKPNPGMLIEASEKYRIDRRISYMIGDRWKDVSAGKKAGCQTIFIDYHYKEKLRDQPDFISENLLQAAKMILKGEFICKHSKI